MATNSYSNNPNYFNISCSLSHLLRLLSGYVEHYSLFKKNLKILELGSNNHIETNYSCYSIMLSNLPKLQLPVTARNHHHDFFFVLSSFFSFLFY